MIRLLVSRVRKARCQVPKMKTATFVRDIETANPGVVQKLYKISPVGVAEWREKFDGKWMPVIETYEYVVVSASYQTLDLYGDPNYVAVHETFIFAAREDGEWVNSVELPGSTRGVLDHTYALNAGGWMIMGNELPSGEEETTEDDSGYIESR
jgi:hypothetical protein